MTIWFRTNWNVRFRWCVNFTKFVCGLVLFYFQFFGFLRNSCQFKRKRANTSDHLALPRKRRGRSLSIPSRTLFRSSVLITIISVCGGASSSPHRRGRSPDIVLVMDGHRRYPVKWEIITEEGRNLRSAAIARVCVCVSAVNYAEGYLVSAGTAKTGNRFPPPGANPVTGPNNFDWR